MENKKYNIEYAKNLKTNELYDFLCDLCVKLEIDVRTLKRYDMDKYYVLSPKSIKEKYKRMLHFKNLIECKPKHNGYQLDKRVDFLTISTLIKGLNNVLSKAKQNIRTIPYGRVTFDEDNTKKCLLSFFTDFNKIITELRLEEE